MLLLLDRSRGRGEGRGGVDAGVGLSVGAAVGLGGGGGGGCGGGWSHADVDVVGRCAEVTQDPDAPPKDLPTARENCVFGSGCRL